LAGIGDFVPSRPGLEVNIRDERLAPGDQALKSIQHGCQLLERR